MLIHIQHQPGAENSGASQGAGLGAGRAADRCIDAGERFDIYVALGAGDTDATIARLTRAIAREQLELPADVLASLATWLSAQAAPEMGEDLGVLIANLKIAREVPTRVPALAPRWGKKAARPPARPG